MNWKKITNHLYQNIKPIDGRIQTRIDDSNNTGIQFSNFYIEFDMNEFMYEDPFYGEQASADVGMFMELIDFSTYYKIKEINELENKYFENKDYILNGFFSNSINIIPKYLKFGEINDDRIEFEMNYSITNSDSYAMMNGTYDEHMIPSGTIKLTLKICELVLLAKNETDLKKLTEKLNPDIYDLQSIRSRRVKSEYRTYEEYEIRYKDKRAKGNSKKWWKF
ncbi:MAG TPA: hypothetical protein VK590_03835 [Saprospiraceae bacterium]|nr:hypothetical protein [Saprospiraceae bacterium]